MLFAPAFPILMSENSYFNFPLSSKEPPSSGDMVTSVAVLSNNSSTTASGLLFAPIPQGSCLPPLSFFSTQFFVLFFILFSSTLVLLSLSSYAVLAFGFFLILSILAC